jgi:hypothetical protein
MGHLTLLAEDVISALDRFPSDLEELILTTYAPHPEWEEYVKGRYSETKKKDRLTLGGPKPSSHMGSSGFPGGNAGGGGGAFGFDGEEAKAFGVGVGAGAGGKAGLGGGAGAGAGAVGGGVGRIAVDEAAMFPGLRLDETNADTFAPRTLASSLSSSSSSSKPSSKFEIEQGDIDGRRVINVGGVERKADVPEDVIGTSSPSRRNDGAGAGGTSDSSGSGVKGEFRRVGVDGGSRSSSGRNVIAGVRNTADFGPAVVNPLEDENEDEDEEKYGNSRTTHVSFSFPLLLVRNRD